MMFWVLEYFVLSSMLQILPVHTPSFNFLHPMFHIKLNSLHPHSHIHEPLTPQRPPRGRRPLLPPVSFSPLASSSLPAGGELPCRGSSTRVGELPHQGAVVMRYPPQTVSFKAWWWWCSTVRRQRGGQQSGWSMNADFLNSKCERWIDAFYN
jgi:hypothetical protein